jgi:hypothetical protein
MSTAWAAAPAQAAAKAAHEAYFARPRQCTLNTASCDGWQSGVRVNGRDAVQVAVQQRVAGLDSSSEEGGEETPATRALYLGQKGVTTET